MDTNLKWTTEVRKVIDLIPYEKNPRNISPRQKAELIKSLKKFNLAEIPAINTDNMILAGHQRIKVMMLLGRGEEEIDVRVPSRQLTEDEVKEYNLRSNKNTGDFDVQKLLGNFSQDMLHDVGFSLSDLKVPSLLDDDTSLEEVPGMSLDGFEAYDYVVVLIRDERDILFIHQALGVAKVDFLVGGIKKRGTGRFVEAKKLIEILKK